MQIQEYIKFIKEKILKFEKYFLKLNISQNQIKLMFGGLFFLVTLLLIVHAPPSNYPVGKVFSVISGQSLEEVTNSLYEMKAIRYPLIFRSYVILQGGEKSVQAGDYLLDKKQGPEALARRLVKGDFHLDTIRVTIPEGWNVYEISEYLSKTLINFDKEKFVKVSEPKEGYLFPDTYFVSPAIKPEDLVQRMAKTFNEKIQKVPGLATSTYKVKDAIIMASILEREARSMEARRTIAGILWNRIKIGMPLQVDVSFLYINGKDTFDLSYADLKIDDPYNTYVNKGLPPGPIGNPGIDSIFAAINPINTKYLYFLTGKDGKMYYAKTFEEHKLNKVKYLY
jgi:UPF0755 protein